MVKLNEFECTANFAWSHDALPLLASASAAGAVDLSFSSSSKLEIFDALNTTDRNAVVETTLDSKVYGLDWSKPSTNASRGTIAAAFETGVVQLWDAAKLIDKKSNLDAATLATGSKHSGHAKTVQFNPTQEHILASAGSKGEIFIWDTNKFDEAVSPGKAMTPMEDVTCLSWNHEVKHVFASAGTTGYTSIWDLRAKKEVLHLTYTGTTGRCNLSVVAWNPRESTQLLTASDNDNAPYILAWNLRNPKEPERIMEGHKKGVLSLDWCKQDNELLLSSGKDNATFLWDPIHGVKLGEYPTTANWVFETRFAPTLPDIFATASFDGKIVVQSLQHTSQADSNPVQTNTAHGDDFWGQLASTETQQPEFAIKKAPKWLKRPTSVSFGFGGKIVHVTQPDAKESKSSISIEKFVTSSGIQKEVQMLSDSMSTKDYAKIVEDRLEKSKGDMQGDWKLLQELLTKDKMTLLKEQIEGDVAEKSTELTDNGTEDKEEADGFFEKLGSGQETLFQAPTGSFKVFSDEDSEIDTKLKKLILGGKSQEAVDLCIDQDRITEALILALNSSDEIKEKVKNAYFAKATPESTVARVLYNASSGDVSDLVNNGDIDNWKEIASSISVFNKDQLDFTTKISELGDRILETNTTSARADALVCYAAGGAIDKISSIWAQEVSAYEKSLLSESSTTSEAHFKALSEFVEKITVYRAANKITGEFSGPGIEKLCNTIAEYAAIVANIGEFDLASELLQLLPSSTEQLKVEKLRIQRASNKKPSAPVVADTGMKKTGSNHAKNLNPYGSAYAPPSLAASSAVPTPRFSPVATNGYTPLAGVPSAASMTPSVNPYAAATGAPTNPYAAVAAASSAAASNTSTRKPSINPYAPSTALDSLKQPVETAPPVGGGHVVPPPPPPKSSQSATTKEVGGWNDLPVHLGVKNAKNTSSPSPYANVAATAQQQQQQMAASRATSYASLQRSAPPPPSAAAINSAAQSPTATPPPSLARQPSKTVKYAPPPGINAMPSPGASNGFGMVSPSPPTAASVPPPNPYAPKPQTNAYAPPPPSHQQPGMSAMPPPPPPSAPVDGAWSMQPPPVAPQPVAPAAPAAPPRHPVGDRSHIPASQAPIFETFASTLEQTASKMPEKYQKQVKDTEKRLNILFDHLNNEDLGQPIVSKLLEIASKIQGGDFTAAAAIQGQVALDHPTECGQWMVGLKRLIQMTEAANR